MNQLIFLQYMKTKLLLLFILTFSLAGSCEPDPVKSDCNCNKVYYTYKVHLDGVQATWYYQKTYSEPVDCQDTNGQYIQIGSNEYFRIECE